MDAADESGACTPQVGPGGVGAPRARAGPPPRVPAAQVVAAPGVDGVLPDGDDGAVGVPHDLPRAHDQLSQDAPGFFIGAVLLWDVLFRGQLGVSLTFIEEMYSRNLGNLFVSPLRLSEFIAGQLSMSVLRTLIGVGGACVFAWLLFRYSIFSLGLPLIAFFVLLIAFGWGIGLAVSAMIMRWGLGAEELAWAAIFLVAPVSGVYYPIAVLPALAAGSRQGAAVGARVRGHARGAAGGHVRWDHFWAATALDVVYLALGAVIFRYAINYAREHGKLLQMGE